MINSVNPIQHLDRYFQWFVRWIYAVKLASYSNRRLV